MMKFLQYPIFLLYIVSTLTNAFSLTQSNPQPHLLHQRLCRRRQSTTIIRYATLSELEPSPPTGGGFSVIRNSVRAATGFSLTAVRASIRTATGLSLTASVKSMSTVLSMFPTWFRYFIQPFLVLYYTPLMIIKSLVGSTNKEAFAAHENVVEGWKLAIERAELKTTELGKALPVHVDDGNIVTNDELDQQQAADAIADSLNVAYSANDSTNDKK